MINRIHQCLVALLLGVAAAGSVSADSFAEATQGPVIITIEDLDLSDGIAAAFTVGGDNLLGYAAYNQTGWPPGYAEFTDVSGAVAVQLPGVAQASAMASAEGAWSVWAALVPWSEGSAEGGVLDSRQIGITANTRVTLRSWVDVFASTNQGLGASVVAYGNLQLDLAGQSFLDQATAFVFLNGQSAESRWLTVGFTTQGQGVEGWMHRVVSANPYQPIGVVPEPETYVLMLAGLAAVAAYAMRRKTGPATVVA